MTVREGVTISHRGSVYEIGRGLGFYGIWVAAARQPTPAEWWPETDEGWVSAWSRFTAIENPAAIVTVDQPADPELLLASRPERGRLRLGGAAFLGLGVLLGVIGLFPVYTEGSSLVSSLAELVPHLFYLAAWAVSAVLLLRGGRASRIGALIAAGTSVVTFGLFFTDLGYVISGGASQGGTGLELSLFGWLASAAGSLLAVFAKRDGLVARPRGREPVLVATLAGLAALGAALSFAPAWDSYVLRTPSGILGTATAGDAFKYPAPIMFGSIAVMVLLVAVVTLSALWRPVWQGAAILAGATVPLVAQVISALIQIGDKTSPETFGISPAQAARIGLTISNGFTAAFWVFCAFTAALILLCARMMTAQAASPAAPVKASSQGPDAFAPSDNPTLGVG